MDRGTAHEGGKPLMPGRNDRDRQEADGGLSPPLGESRITMSAGSRLLDVDYSRGRGYSLYTFDVLMQGPLLGLAIAL